MLRAAALFFFVILLIASLAWLTLVPEQECEDVMIGVGGAILADDEGDQDALTNRAIFERRKCIPAAQKQGETEGAVETQPEPERNDRAE